MRLLAIMALFALFCFVALGAGCSVGIGPTPRHSPFMEPRPVVHPVFSPVVRPQRPAYRPPIYHGPVLRPYYRPNPAFRQHNRPRHHRVDQDAPPKNLPPLIGFVGGVYGQPHRPLPFRTRPEHVPRPPVYIPVPMNPTIIPVPTPALPR